MLKNEFPKVHEELKGFNLIISDKGVEYINVSQERVFEFLNKHLHDIKLEHIYPDAPVYFDPPTRTVGMKKGRRRTKVQLQLSLFE